MRSHAVLAVVAVILLLPAPLAAAPAAPAPAAAASPFADGGVTIDVRLQPSGDAHWNVSATYALNSSAERAAFERLAADFERGERGPGFNVAEFRAVADAAADRTGREMGVVEPNRTGRVLNRSGNLTGVLSLRFTWTNFARVSGDRLLVGDAFAGDWLDHLRDGQRLRIRAPPNYGARTMSPPPSAPVRNGTLVWQGPRTFDAGEPSVAYLEGIATTTTPGTEGPFEGETPLMVAAMGVLLVGGLVAYVLVRREPATDDGSTGETVVSTESSPAAGGTGPDGGAATEPAPPAESEPPPDETAAGKDPGDDAGDEVDPELLSDEERVERLLGENGGRMKQANIVKETGWSNAKVSQLLSSMDEAGRIDKLRIGRENLITLPEEDVEDL